MWRGHGQVYMPIRCIGPVGFRKDIFLYHLSICFRVEVKIGPECNSRIVECGPPARTNIYVLGFVEGGNAWSDIKKFNPFDMKRSAGAGVRIFLPMVGLMGIDWAYGFDKIYGSSQYGGSQFHFILGQEF